MATVDTYPNERRHISDRRASNQAATRTSSSRSMSTLDWAVMSLLVVGGINWGLIGLFSFDLVAAIFGTMTLLTRLVYLAVGIAAAYSIYTLTKLSGKKK